MIANLSFLAHIRNHGLCFIAEGAIVAGEEGDDCSELKKPYRWSHSSNVLINRNPKRADTEMLPSAKTLFYPSYSFVLQASASVIKNHEYSIPLQHPSKLKAVGLQSGFHACKDMSLQPYVDSKKRLSPLDIYTGTRC